MPRVNLTTRNLATLKAEPGKQTDYFDKGFAGFGVRVSYGGKKTYFLMYRRDGKKRRVRSIDNRTTPMPARVMTMSAARSLRR